MGGTGKCEEGYPAIELVWTIPEGQVGRVIHTAFPITPMQAILGPDISEMALEVAMYADWAQTLGLLEFRD